MKKTLLSVASILALIACQKKSDKGPQQPGGPDPRVGENENLDPQQFEVRKLQDNGYAVEAIKVSSTYSHQGQYQQQPYAYQYQQQPYQQPWGRPQQPRPNYGTATAYINIVCDKEAYSRNVSARRGNNGVTLLDGSRLIIERDQRRSSYDYRQGRNARFAVYECGDIGPGGQSVTSVAGNVQFEQQNISAGQTVSVFFKSSTSGRGDDERLVMTRVVCEKSVRDAVNLSAQSGNDGFMLTRGSQVLVRDFDSNRRQYGQHRPSGNDYRVIRCQ